MAMRWAVTLSVPVALVALLVAARMLRRTRARGWGRRRPPTSSDLPPADSPAAAPAREGPPDPGGGAVQRQCCGGDAEPPECELQEEGALPPSCPRPLSPPPPLRAPVRRRRNASAAPQPPPAPPEAPCWYCSPSRPPPETAACLRRSARSEVVVVTAAHRAAVAYSWSQRWRGSVWLRPPRFPFWVFHEESLERRLLAEMGRGPPPWPDVPFEELQCFVDLFAAEPWLWHAVRSRQSPLERWYDWAGDREPYEVGMTLKTGKCLLRKLAAMWHALRARWSSGSTPTLSSPAAPRRPPGLWSGPRRETSRTCPALRLSWSSARCISPTSGG
eukprot:TRINITY_DN12330_c4_g1_i3.p1 TRINITY_DN12330_c4_g1~~TRINITY_DN12330_c4_g1_i3.p1  ORF type:complete len:363 (+),score=65.10 TRINITY_DN12330_c4_g1_i3:98-1090(+)